MALVKCQKSKFSIGKIVFWLKLFWAHFIPRSYAHFLYQYEKKDFNTPFYLFKDKSFHLLEGTMNLFVWEIQNARTAQYFEKRFFYKQTFDFHCPSKILCLTSKLRNFVKITGPYYRAPNLFRCRISYFKKGSMKVQTDEKETQKWPYHRGSVSDTWHFGTDQDPRIRNNDLRIRIRGSVPLTYGTGSTTLQQGFIKTFKMTQILSHRADLQCNCHQ